MSFVYVNCITKDKKHMTCIYNLHRQKTKYIWHVYTICIDKKQKNIWHVYTIYTDKRQKTYDMYILSVSIVYTWHMFFVFFLCKLYMHVICFLSFVYVNCIYNLHRQKKKNIWHVYTIYIEKRHMTCIYNLHRQKTKNIWHVYTIYTCLCKLYIHVICLLSM
jgi:hypothetical protein